MTENMSFYKFMSILDKLTIDNQDIDFHDITVHCNRLLGQEIITIKHKGKILEIITLNKE